MAKINKRLVDTVDARARDYVIWDDELPGFGLRVFASGKRSYVLQYRSAGRSRRYTIGLHGVWTPETARREARVQLGKVAQGDNPVEDKQINRHAMTVKQLRDRYLDRHACRAYPRKGSASEKAITHLYGYRPHHMPSAPALKVREDGRSVPTVGRAHKAPPGLYTKPRQSHHSRYPLVIEHESTAAKSPLSIPTSWFS